MVYSLSRLETRPVTLKRFLSLWLPVVLWCGLIFALSNTENLRITEGPLDFVLRKTAHLGEYFILVLFLWRALAGSTDWPLSAIFSMTLALAILYAASDEYHQTYIPGRVGCLHDVLIDSAGASIACFVRRFFGR